MIARRRSQRGAAAVEFALLVPILLLMLFGTISYGYMFSFRQALSQSAEEGARAAIGAPLGTGTCVVGGPYAAGAVCPPQLVASQAVASSLSGYNMTCGTANLVCSITAPTATGCADGHTCVKVTVSYPYRDHSLLPSVPVLNYTLPTTLSFTSTVEVS